MSASEPIVAPARTAAELDAAKALIRAYVEWLGVDLSFQNIEAEMAGFPGKYLPPRGEILIARVGEAIAGVVCLQPLGDGICEMKRMWTDPAFRGLGIGRRLAAAVIDAGRTRAYRRMRLDTLERLTSAVALYESLGFRRIAPYYHNPVEGVIYLEIDLEIDLELDRERGGAA
jgi:ribosomal protein S18 acetylase RimI-like enzyme